MTTINWNNKEEVMAAVCKDGMDLVFASAEMRADRDVVLAAVKQNGNALRHASDALRNDRDLVRTVVLSKPFAFEYASDELRGDRDFVLGLFATSNHVHCLLMYASDELRADREVVLTAVRKDGWCLQCASDALKNDREVVNAAIDADDYGSAIMSASNELRNDPETALRALKRSSNAWYYIGANLLSHPSFIARAFKELGDDMNVEADFPKIIQAISRADVLDIYIHM